MWRSFYDLYIINYNFFLYYSYTLSERVNYLPTKIKKIYGSHINNHTLIWIFKTLLLKNMLHVFFLRILHVSKKYSFWRFSFRNQKNLHTKILTVTKDIYVYMYVCMLWKFADLACYYDRIHKSINSILLKSVHKLGRREFNSPCECNAATPIYVHIYKCALRLGDSFSSQGEHGKIRVILVRAEIDYVPTPKGSEENIGSRKRVSVIGITLGGSIRRVIFLELTDPASAHTCSPRLMLSHIVPNIIYIISVYISHV